MLSGGRARWRSRSEYRVQRVQTGPLPSLLCGPGTQSLAASTRWMSQGLTRRISSPRQPARGARIEACAMHPGAGVVTPLVHVSLIDTKSYVIVPAGRNVIGRVLLTGQGDILGPWKLSYSSRPKRRCASRFPLYGVRGAACRRRARSTRDRGAWPSPKTMSRTLQCSRSHRCGPVSSEGPCDAMSSPERRSNCSGRCAANTTLVTQLVGSGVPCGQLGDCRCGSPR